MHIYVHTYIPFKYTYIHIHTYIHGRMNDCAVPNLIPPLTVSLSEFVPSVCYHCRHIHHHRFQELWFWNGLSIADLDPRPKLGAGKNVRKPIDITKFFFVFGKYVCTVHTYLHITCANVCTVYINFFTRMHKKLTYIQYSVCIHCQSNSNK